jgi:tetratricopeptide (TPR) repeat protein
MSKRRRKSKAPIAPVDSIQESVFSFEHWHLRIVAGLCALGFLIYANTFTASFHFDDFAVVINNPAIRNLWDLGGIFNAFNTRVVPGWTFAVNYAVGQLNVVGYHFLNIWLHVCNAVLLYAFAHQLLSLDERNSRRNDVQKVWIAFAAALLFLAHPLATQPVNYIWQRTTLLVTFFYLGTLVLYIQSYLIKSRNFYIAALGTCLLAMLSKENAFLLPVMLLLIELVFFRDQIKTQKFWFRVLPFVLIMAIVPILLQRTDGLTLDLMRPYTLTQGVSENVISREDYLMTQVNVLRTYLRFFIVPAGQNVDHDYPLASSTGWMAWLTSVFVLVLFLSAGLYLFSRNRIVSLCIFWFFVTTLIESLVTSPDFFVEHRMYLPMVGLCLASTILLFDSLGGSNIKVGMIIVLIVVSVLAVLTVKRNLVWKDDLTLWSDAVEKSPLKARPFNNRGLVFKNVGYLDLALNDFNRAIAINPKYAQAYQNRGHLQKMKGDYEAALVDYSKVLLLEPGNSDIYASRGSIYKRKGEMDKAMEDYTESIRLNSKNPETYSLRAYLYQLKDELDRAMADYNMAVLVQPQYVYAYNNRGNLFLKKGDLAGAINDYNRSIAIDPSFGEAYMNRAVAYFQLGKLKESKADIDRARQMGVVPNSEFVRNFKDALKGKNISMHP